MRLTCNKKAYPQFRGECDKCPMRIECVDKDKSVFVGIIEPSSVNITVNFGGNNEVSDKVNMERISQVLADAVKNAAKYI